VGEHQNWLVAVMPAERIRDQLGFTASGWGDN
jgi:hypothetical protein